VPRPSFRDRFFTPPVARAITSPSGIVLAGLGASVGILAGLPIVGWAALGALAYAARVGASVPRGNPGERIDPFTLTDPWRRFVSGAMQARRKFDEAVRSAKPGPLRDRLLEIGGRLEDAVHECWRVARQGQALADARGQLDTRAAQAELDELQRSLGGAAPAAGSTDEGTLAALQAQLASAQRMDRTIADARDRLRLLDARMDESVARAVELSVRAGGVDELGGLGDDVEGIVGDMEALRQGLEEADRPTPGVA
jgi:hypothetical protein